MQNPGIEERAAGVARRRHRTVEEKRRIVQESLKPGASVALVARRFDVNANQIFTWRRQLRGGKLTGKREGSSESQLLPVAMHEVSVQAVQHSPPVAAQTPCTGRIEIDFCGGRRLWREGRADPETLSAVIRELSQP